MQKSKCHFHDVDVAGEVTAKVCANSLEKVCMCFVFVFGFFCRCLPIPAAPLPSCVEEDADSLYYLLLAAPALLISAGDRSLTHLSW